MKATVVEQDFAVAPQVTAADIADLAKEGVKTLINNRPDGEEPVQLSSADARAQAEKLGLLLHEQQKKNQAQQIITSFNIDNRFCMYRVGYKQQRSNKGRLPPAIFR